MRFLFCVQINQQTLLTELDDTYASDKLTADYIFSFIFNILIVNCWRSILNAFNVVIHEQMREWTVNFNRREKKQLKWTCDNLFLSIISFYYLLLSIGQRDKYSHIKIIVVFFKSIIFLTREHLS